MKYAVDFAKRGYCVKNPDKKWYQFWKEDYIEKFGPEVSIYRFNGMLTVWWIFIQEGKLKFGGDIRFPYKDISLDDLNDNLLKLIPGSYHLNRYYKKIIGRDYTDRPIYSNNEYDYSSVEYELTDDSINWDEIKKYLDNDYEENN